MNENSHTVLKEPLNQIHDSGRVSGMQDETTLNNFTDRHALTHFSPANSTRAACWNARVMAAPAARPAALLAVKSVP